MDEIEQIAPVVDRDLPRGIHVERVTAGVHDGTVYRWLKNSKRQTGSEEDYPSVAKPSNFLVGLRLCGSPAPSVQPGPIRHSSHAASDRSPRCRRHRFSSSPVLPAQLPREYAYITNGAR